MSPASEEPLLRTTALESATLVARGKVRDVYAIGDDLLLVATDRLSAFDVVMSEGIPGKGLVLTALSAFWFRLLGDVIPNHLLSTDADAWDDLSPADRAVCRRRTMRCRRATPLPVEWVVRGYLTGSGWNDYRARGAVSGVALPPGLDHASRFDAPILTPSTKAVSGHDEPIPFERVVELVGADVAHAAREAAVQLYSRGHAHALSRGIVLADTKFEFGLVDGRLVLIDECLTPDSSRFWPAEEVRPGARPTSYDKQFVRDWLVSTGWDRQPPPPTLPPEVIAKTARTYAEIEARLTVADDGEPR